MRAIVASRPPGKVLARPAIAAVVQQHLEDAAILHATRTALTSAPHVKLLQLSRFDERLAAHLDGVAVGGEDASAQADAALEFAGSNTLFVAAVGAIQEPREERLTRLFALVQAMPECLDGLISAFGWLDPEQLRGVVSALLKGREPERRLVGVAASALHRVDPGLVTARRLDDPDPTVRARALRTAGELGKRELLSALAAAILDADATCQFWAAWSAVLLGDRHNALEFLKAAALSEGPLQARAFQLALLAMNTADAQVLLRQLASEPAKVRKLIQGAGLSGDVVYVPWLIGHMADDKLARVAGEAFSMITGADLALLDLERKPPDTIDAGPNDDPEDADVEMDADEGLPWPEQGLVQGWWTQNGSRFTPGVRQFVGAPVTRSHCIDVLKTGYQRQRIAAAYHLCLLNPGTPLFEWRAPAWRQQRELAQMA
jgi:uncharacterized protein (TIGR02270 family)